MPNKRLNQLSNSEQLEFCSFIGVDEKTKKNVVCDNPVFDQKKQLCQQHSHQVRQRFQEFLADKSIASKAAWEKTWGQSGDWRYFWNLAQEESKGEGPATKKKQKDWGSAPIHETTENIRSLEIDKRTLRKTNRVHQFNTSVSQEWMTKLKQISYEERLKYVEVLEKALDCYERERIKK